MNYLIKQFKKLIIGLKGQANNLFGPINIVPFFIFYFYLKTYPNNKSKFNQLNTFEKLVIYVQNHLYIKTVTIIKLFPLYNSNGLLRKINHIQTQTAFSIMYQNNSKMEDYQMKNNSFLQFLFLVNQKGND
jgi:hypothetical protein